MKIQVTACDKDKEVPALTYEIKVSDGREISADLCAKHGRKIEELIEELLEGNGEQAEAEAAPNEVASEPESAVEAPPAAMIPAAAPAKKATAKKTATKKATAAKKTTRRRPKITTVEAIEAEKQQD
jgi:hypothetical protein